LYARKDSSSSVISLVGFTRECDARLSLFVDVALFFGARFGAVIVWLAIMLSFVKISSGAF
jgi:hypothetical protein